MSFAAPLFLLAVLVVPLGWLAERALRGRRRRTALRFPATGTVAAVAPRMPSWRRWLPPALFALAVVALVLGLARPERTVAVAVEEASVVLVSDTSGSMAAEDVEPTRLDAARAAAETFLEGVPDGVRVGLVGFSSVPHTTLAPTLDRETVKVTLASLAADGGTATGDALAAALDTIEAQETTGRRPPSAIVLLSDGATTEGRDPVQAAREARRQNVPVYTVSLGTPDGVVPGRLGGVIPVPPDPETMRRIAEVSGGKSFTAEDADELDGIYRDLGRQVGSKPEQREMTAGFAGAGLVLLLASLALATRWRRPL
jgi:Ca-activated chloride channel family protein